MRSARAKLRAKHPQLLPKNIAAPRFLARNKRLLIETDGALCAGNDSPNMSPGTHSASVISGTIESYGGGGIAGTVPLYDLANVSPDKVGLASLRFLHQPSGDRSLNLLDRFTGFN